MSAIRTLAVAATDNGLLAPEPTAGIARVKSAKSCVRSAKSISVRSGKYLTLRLAQALLNAPTSRLPEAALPCQHMQLLP